MRARRTLSIGAVAAAVVTLCIGGSVSAASAADHVSFPNAKPGWAKAANDAGSAPDDQTIDAEVGFDLKDPAGAAALAQAVATPGSPAYGHYLAPQRWIDRFSPSKSDFYSTLRFLKSNGAIITGTPRSRLFIAFRATADQLDAIFGAQMHVYHYRGHTLAAPSAVPTLSASVAHGVAGVVLDESRLLTRPAAKAAAPAPVSLPGVQCSSYWFQHTAKLPEAYGRTVFPTANCGYYGPQFRSAYGAPASLKGAGQSVAIIDAYGAPTIVQDVNTFAARHGLTGLSPATYRQSVAGRFYDQALCGYPSGWQVEQTIDVIAVHGIAPQAQVRYFGGYNCGTGLDVEMSQILDGHLANIVSNSYGFQGEFPADEVTVNENQHLQAAAEGIGLYFSSGDDGDESEVLGTPSADYPATSPYVTAVGGTSTEIAKNGSVALETGWGNHYDSVLQDPGTGAVSYAETPPGDFASGAGGGISTVFARPWYQQGVVAAGGRGVPDVAAVADPRTGERIGYRPIDDASGTSGSYTEAIYGGTSLASPLLAAEVAIVQQSTHRVFGFINPLAYGAYKKGAPVFRDVLPKPLAVAYNDQFTGLTSLVTGDLDTSLTVARGWDRVTGLGALRLDPLPRGMR